MKKWPQHRVDEDVLSRVVHEIMELRVLGGKQEVEKTTLGELKTLIEVRLRPTQKLGWVEFSGR